MLMSVSVSLHVIVKVSMSLHVIVRASVSRHVGVKASLSLHRSVIMERLHDKINNHQLFHLSNILTCANLLCTCVLPIRKE